jgi:CRISPR system Cascade subunit CasA
VQHSCSNAGVLVPFADEQRAKCPVVGVFDFPEPSQPMAYDLRHEPWIPWRRRSGAVEWGAPALLLDELHDREGDFVVGVAAPRPDFNGALQEFLIGLLTAALIPEDDREWEDRMAEPPTSDGFSAVLDRLPAAFDLEGDGPRFFQDLSAAELEEGAFWTAESLLIGMPNTEAKDATKRSAVRDLFVKPARIERLGRPAAAMALLTMQTYAPAGGAGHRTSLRGGGPLTTLVDPRVDAAGTPLAHAQPLWHKLWANVETRQALGERSVAGAPDMLEAAFPWLRPTRVSNPKAGGGPTPPAAAHALQAYFGLPRRIRLEFGDAGPCDLTGKDDERTVVGFRMRIHGVQYAGWQHPLSPHYRQNANSAEWLPMHGQPGGISWRDWVGLALQGGERQLRRPAAVVPAYARRVGQREARTARLHVFGYDMDNMKARGWTESIVPLFLVDDEARRRRMRETAEQLAEATGVAAAALLYAAKAARYQNPKEASGDIGHVRAELWDGTETAFYRTMERLAEPRLEIDDVEPLADTLRAEFREVLRDEALAVFDRWCPTPGLAPEALRRRVLARHDLNSTMNGYTKLGEQLFTALGVPLPGGGRAVRAARKRASTEATT